jgi:glycosyltransferase involved in cell wall biosynthesis
MNVGLVNHWYPPEAASGGIATYNTALAQTLTKLGHRVVVISSTRQRKPRLESVDGICVTRLPYPRVSSRWNRLPVLGRQMRAARTWLYARAVARALPKIVAQHQLDILEYADIEAEALFHREVIAVPYVIRLHGPLFALEPYYSGKEQPFARGWIKQMERRAVVRADAWTAPSWHVASLVTSAYALPAARVNIIPNLHTGDDCEWTPPERAEPVVLFVGRLEWLKGAETFAEAIPLVLARTPRIRFMYVAWDRPRPDGSSMKVHLIEKLKAAGALDRVDFLTFSGDGCLYAELQPDICVVPSRFETFSYPCLEAMVHGLPVVASRAAAIPELVEDDVTGILFEPGNERGLAEGIVQLAMNPARRQAMGQAGREKARREFQPLDLAQRMVQVYEETRRR